jgi:hypothetical protein
MLSNFVKRIKTKYFKEIGGKPLRMSGGFGDDFIIFRIEIEF